MKQQTKIWINEETENLHDTSGGVVLSEYAKEKLNYINGHHIIREFPNIEKMDLQWVGAVLDLLDELKLNKIL